MSCDLLPILKLQVSKVKSDALNIDNPFDELLFEKLENLPKRVQMAALCRYLRDNALVNSTVYMQNPVGFEHSQFKETIFKSDASALMKVVLV